MVQLPPRLPGLRLLLIITGLYAVVWLALEGDLRQLLLLAGLMTATSIGRLFQRFWAGQRLPVRLWLLSGLGLGTLAGFTQGILVFMLMALKTGLHSHGPEFSREQIVWVVTQMPLWLVVGLCLGLAVALLYLGARGTLRRDNE